MDSKTYIANAIKTESVPEQFEMNQVALHALMEVAIAASNAIDLVKRRLFYGTAIDTNAMLAQLGHLNGLTAYVGQAIQGGDDINRLMTPEELAECDLPVELRGLNLANLDKRLTHCALGCYTESGELIGAMQKQYETGILDRVNFGEEVGDIEWYQAIGFDASGVSEATCREKNIAKLKARYPGKFTVEAALNRDLAAERAILAKPEVVIDTPAVPVV
jgi:hypothetical protein